MTPFVIFAIVLTFGYFIYFAIMITLDLTAKPADGQKNEEEDIDVGDMNDEGVEAPKVINEESDIEGGRMTYTDSVTDDGLRIINPTNSSVPSQDEDEPPVEPAPVSEEKEKVTSEELNEENEYGMEDMITQQEPMPSPPSRRRLQSTFRMWSSCVTLLQVSLCQASCSSCQCRHLPNVVVSITVGELMLWQTPMTIL